MGILIYLFNQICGFQLTIMYTIYYFTSQKFTVLQDGKWQILCLTIIALIWLINLIIIHLEALINIGTAIYIVIYPFIWVIKWIYKKLLKISLKSTLKEL